MLGGIGVRGHSEEVQLTDKPACPGGLDAVGRYRGTRDIGKKSGSGTFGAKGRKEVNKQFIRRPFFMRMCSHTPRTTQESCWFIQFQSVIRVMPIKNLPQHFFFNFETSTFFSIFYKIVSFKKMRLMLSWFRKG
jgi:hypothetical protein